MLISIHALLAESDRAPSPPRQEFYKFLSTLSLRRATHLFASSGVDFAISIHALLAESDGILAHHARKIIKFLSTLSLRRATSNESGEDADNGNFYPRSPCGERLAPEENPTQQTNFYPRSPCGERHMSGATGLIFRAFLSTLSLRRATPINVMSVSAVQISIHALLAESDHLCK